MNRAVLGYEPLTDHHVWQYLLQTPTLMPGEGWEYATLYVRLCPIAGIRTSIALAQAIHETGYFRFQGIARAEWNNPAGLGVTGGEGIGNRFPTKEVGVRAHLGHLLWYFSPHHPVAGFCEHDQRHFGWNGGHKNLENDITSLSGRWAPSSNYGLALAQLADLIAGFKVV